MPRKLLVTKLTALNPRALLQLRKVKKVLETNCARGYPKLKNAYTSLGDAQVTKVRSNVVAMMQKYFDPSDQWKLELQSLQYENNEVPTQQWSQICWSRYKYGWKTSVLSKHLRL